MTLKLLTIDAFRAAVKEGGRPEGAVFRLAAGDSQQVEGATRTRRFVFSDDTVDLSGDSIDQSGWELADFNANPVALFSHMSWEPPIGRASNVNVKKGKLVGDIEFASADIYPFADTIYRLVEGGFLKAVSVGFMPLEYDYARDKDRPYGIDFVRQKLLEISVCCVPCNPNALGAARSMGIDTEPLRDWASKVLDTGGSVMIPRDVLEETFRQAKTPRAVRQKYLAKSEAEDWKSGAAGDLPVVIASDWDGAAAAKRMLDAAGFDSETPDTAKAARGFLINDAANPTLRSSYKMPFADIIGGELKAVKSGIASAASRLSDAPAALQADIKTTLAIYEKTAGEIKDVPAVPGTCGRDASQECGMKDSMECMVHAAPADKTIATPEHKSGRRISSANEALLRVAMGHHESASKCIKTVLETNAVEEPDDDQPGSPDPDDLTVQVPDQNEDPKAKRLREARELRKTLKA